MTYSPDLVVSRAPHLKIRAETTLQIMCEVMFALVPATLLGIHLFGSNAAAVIIAAVIAAVATEAVVQRRLSSPSTAIGDGSAALTGLLLALTLPPTLPPGYAAAGAVCAILFGKVLQGGLGRNLFNPALVGRAIMLAVWPAPMSNYVDPVDGATAATPLGGGAFGIGDIVVRAGPGSIGEASAVLLILGALLLLIRGRIEWRIPLFFILSAALFGSIVGANPVVQVFSGGLMLGALFMATDWVTSPMSNSGKILFGIGCGVATVAIRQFGQFPEGGTYAILLMNAHVPLIDRYLKRKALGETRR